MITLLKPVTALLWMRVMECQPPTSPYTMGESGQSVTGAHRIHFAASF